MKNINEYAFDRLLNESVVVLSTNFVSALENIKKMPENKWGFSPFVRDESGPDSNEYSGNLADGSGTAGIFKGWKVNRERVIDFINQILNNDIKFNPDTNLVYVDIEKSDSLETKVMVSSQLASMLRKDGLGEGDTRNSTFHANKEILSTLITGDDVKNLPRNTALKALDDLSSGLTSTTKLGKVLRKLKYENIPNDKVLNALIEEVVVRTSLVTSGDFEELLYRGVEIKEVTGEDIRKYYLIDNYGDEDTFCDSTTNKLYSSCMRHKTKKFLDIYVEKHRPSIIMCCIGYKYRYGIG